MTDEKPTIVKVRGIDVQPHRYGIWCSIGGGKPFVNEIVNRRWAEDGSDRISIMLESFNFDIVGRDEWIDVVEFEYNKDFYTPERLAKEKQEFDSKDPTLFRGIMAL